MRSLLSQLSDRVGAAFAAEGLDPGLGQVLVSSRPELAQFQCNGAMAAARQAGRPPRELAEAVAEKLRADPGPLEQIEVAGPGFLNLRIDDRFLAELIHESGADPRLGVKAASPSLTVLVDYAGPNVAKAMHVGHLRATIIGDSLARLFRFLGHKVIRDPHFGDWGLQMGQVIAAIEEQRPDLPFFDLESDGPYPDTSPVTLDDLQEIYPRSSARTESDPEWGERVRQVTVDLQQGRPGYLALWRHMKRVSEESQRQDFSALGVEFDLWFGESDVAELVSPLITDLRERGLAEESRGALVMRVELPDDKRDLPPLILETSRGAVLYGTTDLATILHRVRDLGVDLALYVVDARQSDHFELLFRAARRSGYAPDDVGLEHIRFGTMNGPDGRPFKTRAGGVVSLADLIELMTAAARRRLDEADLARSYPQAEREAIARQVGVAALKFGDLINNRVSDYSFDLERFSSFEGKTGPYLQYSAVRIRSIQRRAAGLGMDPGLVLPPTVEPERNLMLTLLQLPEVLERAGVLRAPNHIAEYAFELAAAWNRFYDACHIIDERNAERRGAWLALADLTLRTLTTVLDLLGIEVPERM
ncbi:MAG: arginine--tRNA ligase [Acidimicrobiia bacterium]|nr:arginine--tRNA ligase [Acidimicrobiia bacterium]MDQ3499898.1 arginine--tRNA ligase [Actinomycetota bacterium]